MELNTLMSGITNTGSYYERVVELSEVEQVKIMEKILREDEESLKGDSILKEIVDRERFRSIVKSYIRIFSVPNYPGLSDNYRSDLIWATVGIPPGLWDQELQGALSSTLNVYSSVEASKSISVRQIPQMDPWTITFLVIMAKARIDQIEKFPSMKNDMEGVQKSERLLFRSFLLEQGLASLDDLIAKFEERRARAELERKGGLMAQVESRSRARVTAYTSALIVAVASSVFLEVVPFLPAPPILPLLVGLALGGLSLRNKGVAIATLYLLVYFSVLWQMIGFGFFQLLSAGVGVAVLLAMAVPLFPFLTKRVDLSSMALAILAVALMLTPAYFVSIPLVAVAALTFGSLASLEALALTFVFFLTPFLLLENALYFTTTSGATAPIIFGQFSLLAQNLRPPLPGLNILLTGLPANYLSHLALPSLYMALGQLGSAPHPDGDPRRRPPGLLVDRQPGSHLHREVREGEGA